MVVEELLGKLYHVKVVLIFIFLVLSQLLQFM